MKSNPAQFAEINLLPEDPFFTTILGRTIRWALTAGRYLVIFTELIVIVSFATRFKLDRQRTDLNSAIDQKKAVIQSYGNLEKNFRQVQARLAYFKAVSHNRINTDLFLQLTKIIPNDVTIDKLTITDDHVNVSGLVPSQIAFNTLITNLQTSAYFTHVSVGKIEKNAKSENFKFQFTAQIKQTSSKSVKNNKLK